MEIAISRDSRLDEEIEQIVSGQPTALTDESGQFFTLTEDQIDEVLDGTAARAHMLGFYAEKAVRELRWRRASDRRRRDRR